MDENDSSSGASKRSSAGAVSFILVCCIAGAAYFLFWDRPPAGVHPDGAEPSAGQPANRRPAGQPSGNQPVNQPANQTVVPLGNPGANRPATAPQARTPAASKPPVARDLESGVVLLDFTARWCGPCRTQGPIVDKVAQSFSKKAVVSKVDVDKEPDLADRFDVTGLPTIVILKEGKEVTRFVGLTTQRALTNALNAALKPAKR